MRAAHYNLIEVDWDSIKYIQTASGFKLHHEDKSGMKGDYMPRWGYVRSVCEEEKFLEEGDHVLLHHKAYKAIKEVDGKGYFCIPPKHKSPFIHVKAILRKGLLTAYDDISICKPIPEKKFSEGGIIKHLHWKEEFKAQEAKIEYSNIFKRGDVIKYIINADYEDYIQGHTKDRLRWLIEEEHILSVNGQSYNDYVRTWRAPKNASMTKKNGLYVEMSDKEKKELAHKCIPREGEWENQEMLIQGAVRCGKDWYVKKEHFIAPLRPLEAP